MKPWERLLFNGWSAEKAWFLGILYGDGNVHKSIESGNYKVSAVGSLSTLTRWLVLLDPERSPQEIKRSPGTYQGQVYSKELVERLELEFGVCGPKADKLVWPKDLPTEFERDFIRGLWDSDGSIFIESRRHRKANGNDSPRANFCSKCESFTLELRAKLEAAIPELKRVSVCKETSARGEWYVFKYGGKQAMLVADYLYADPPAHLVNDDRVEMYNKLCELRCVVDNSECPCGEKATHESFCQKCWWANNGVTTGPGTKCSNGCDKPVFCNTICSACFSRQKRARPDYQRKSTGTCSCGKPAFRKSKCDGCYMKARREAKALPLTSK